MPGVNLNLDLPSVGDNMATVVSKTATALSAIQTDLTPRIGAGQLNISGTLQCQGALVNGIGGLTFVNGASVATTAPSLFFSGGELFALTAAGVVKVTNGGVVNVAGSGGIGGDYPGHVGALVSLVYSSGTYSFVHDPGVFSDLKFAHAQLTGSGAVVTIGVDAAMTTASFNFKSLPASGVSLLAFDASTSALQKAEAAAITNALTINTLTIGTKLSTAEVYNKALANWLQSGGTASVVGVNYGFAQNSATPCQGAADTALRQGDRIQQITVYFNKTTAGTLSLKLNKYVFGGTSSNVQTSTTVATGVGSLTMTVGSPVAIATQEAWSVEVDTPANGDTVRMVQVTWDHP